MFGIRKQQDRTQCSRCFICFILLLQIFIQHVSFSDAFTIPTLSSSTTTTTTARRRRTISSNQHKNNHAGILVSFSATNNDNNNDDNSSGGIRLNKVFKQTHSRRQADQLIASGRVTVNGQPVTSKGGFKVQPYQDKVALDGQIIQGWEQMNALSNDIQFEYVKYWKPRGVTCTTDSSIRGNIIDEIAYDGYTPSQRVYPVGRLDKDTSGLILLTSDGRLPNSALRGKYKQPKVYHVMVDKPITDEHIDQLRKGIVITTLAQRSGPNERKAKPLTAKTKPCKVERLKPKQQKQQQQHNNNNTNNSQLNGNVVQMTLVEGRNRQIRKMMAALDYTVVKLHRIQFMGITLDPLQRPGDWKYVSSKELEMLQNVIQQAENDTHNDDDDNDEYDETS